MPIYMDKHQGQQLTAQSVAQAHAADLSIEEKYDCKFLTYWFDEDRDCVFCLVEAPDITAVRKAHEESHGFVHSEIMEVDPEVVRAFLGRVEDPSPAHGEVAIDSPFRAIMFTDIEGSTRMISELGDEKSMEVLREHNALTRDALRSHAGREVKHTGDGFMASFASVVKAVECAMQIQRKLAEHNQQESAASLNLRIGLCAGEPVQNDRQLYGAAVNLAARLCAHAEPGSILAAQVVRDLCTGKTIPFIDRGEFEARGFDEPVPVYEIAWKDGRQ